jgi:hypothetical protein
MWENHQYGSVRAFIKIKLPKGNYNYEFYSTRSGQYMEQENQTRLQIVPGPLIIGPNGSVTVIE